MKSIKILYFASFRESLGLDFETLQLDDDVKTIVNLRALLESRKGAWGQIFNDKANVLVSINQNMTNDQAELSDQDEIAFFPPVTGG